MALRILAAWWADIDLSMYNLPLIFIYRYLMGQDSGFPAVNFNAWNINGGINTHVNVQADHAK